MKELKSLVNILAFLLGLTLVFAFMGHCYGEVGIGGTYSIEAPYDHWDSDQYDHEVWSFTARVREDMGDKWWLDGGLVYTRYSAIEYGTETETRIVQKAAKEVRCQCCCPKPPPKPEPEVVTTSHRIRRDYDAASYGFDLWLKRYVFKKLYLGAGAGLAILNKDHPDLRESLIGSYGGCVGVRTESLDYEVSMTHSSNPFKHHDGLNTMNFKIMFWF